MAAVSFQGVDKLPAVYLLLVGEAVAVRVLAVGVGSQPGFVIVAQAVAVAIGQGGVAPFLQLEEVGEAVAIGVPLAVVGVVAAVLLVEQAVAVEVFHAREGEAAGLAPAQRVAAILVAGVAGVAAFAGVEPVQCGREDIPLQALAQVGEGGLAVVVVCANVADGDGGRQRNDPAFLRGYGVGLGQVEFHRAVDAGLFQGERLRERLTHHQRGFSIKILALSLPLSLYLIALDAFDLVPLIATIARVEHMLDGGGIQVGVGVLPEIDGRLPVKGHVGQGDSVDHFQAILNLIAGGKALFGIHQRRMEIHRLGAAVAVQIAYQGGLAVDGPLDGIGEQAGNPFAEPLAEGTTGERGGRNIDV